nr:hypothetical protein CFP56_19957 [Quercus suber]
MGHFNVAFGAEVASAINANIHGVWAANSDRQAPVRLNLQRPRAAATDFTGPTGQPLSFSLLKLFKLASQPEVLIGKSL